MKLPLTLWRLDIGKVTAKVTLKCVGRAKLSELKRWKPYMVARCQPISDDDEFTSAQDLKLGTSLMNDMEKILQSSKAKQALYQQNFWLALNALDYKPTSLLTRDPSSTNTQKELEAASWAILSTLEDKGKLYRAFCVTNLLERLQFGLRAIMEDSFTSANMNQTTAMPNFDIGFE